MIMRAQNRHVQFASVQYGPGPALVDFGWSGIQPARPTQRHAFADIYLFIAAGLMRSGIASRSAPSAVSRRAFVDSKDRSYVSLLEESTT